MMSGSIASWSEPCIRNVGGRISIVNSGAVSPNTVSRLTRAFPQVVMKKVGRCTATLSGVQLAALAGSSDMPSESAFEAIRYAQDFAREGYSISEGALTEGEVENLREAVAGIPNGEEVRRKRGVYGVRNLLEICPAVEELVRQANIRQFVTPVLGRAPSQFVPSTLTRFPAPTGHCSGTRTM